MIFILVVSVVHNVAVVVLFDVSVFVIAIAVVVVHNAAATVIVVAFV